jgi:hypothetical protein
MTSLTLKLTLLSDAELGTGLGTETVNGLVPRDPLGQPTVPSTHLKGLLRDRLLALSISRAWTQGEELMAALLGEPGDDGKDGRPAGLHIGDASPVQGSRATVITITRTAVGRLGTVAPGSLRTVEAVAAGSQFSASVRIPDKAGSPADLAARLGLMAIENIGGGRTRGAGLCRIEIAGETRSPGTLLRKLEQQLAAQGPTPMPPPQPAKAGQPSPLAGGPPHWFRLVFRADSAVCCPESPVNGSTNHIRSGPVIPSSAIQGALITRIASIDPSLADACFADARFRAWPLVPVLPGNANPEEEVPLGVRVDIAHRMSKLANTDTGAHDVRDSAIEPYFWSDVAGGSPLKSSDGILRRESSGAVKLWKANELPRLISGHGVHYDATGTGRRTLFAVEALAPMVFSGLVALPEKAAHALEQALRADPVVSLGKARSVRGTGLLELRPATDLSAFLQAALPDKLPGQVFVVQSPLALPDDYQVGRAESALQYLAEDAGWGKVLISTDDNDGRAIPRTAATCGVRFGWNRHGLGTKADPRHRRLRARRVILPGSVLVLDRPLANVEAKLLAGLGDGRENGFGCLLPHPGMAAPIPYRPPRAPVTIASRDEAGRRALELFRKAGEANGPSPSQIAAVGRRVGSDPTTYLEKQYDRGAVRHWHRWEPVFEEVKELVKGDPQLARNTLRAWQDLAIIYRPAGKGAKS